ncbi:MAG: ferrous iron transport protein A [Robiginitomaculum sp.]|nr:MAG: ferrous iron transport protein A [Robiginitomaculum sp.]
MTTQIKLADMAKNVPAKITGFCADTPHTEIRLREIGFAEGDVVEITHIGLFGGSPLNIRLHGTSIAMRPQEAGMIRVIPVQSPEG